MRSFEIYLQNMTAKILDFLSTHAFGVSFSTFCYAQMSKFFLSANVLTPWAENAIKISAILSMFVVFITLMLKFIELLEKLHQKAKDILNHFKKS